MGIIERKEREKKIRREDILKAAEAVFLPKAMKVQRWMKLQT